MREVVTQTLTILNESSPYLLFGFLLAGVLHVVLSRYPRLTAVFTAPGRRGVVTAALLGLPMPLCSCGVLPAAMTLRRQGATKGAAASFLISVPETDVVSILLTLALLGGTMAWYRPAAALVTAIAAGLVVNAVDRRIHEKHMAGHHATGETGCGCDDCHSDSLVERGEGPWWRRALRHGFVEVFDDIAAQLLLGIAVAGVLMTWLPGIEMAQRMGDSPWTYLVMLAVGVPVYVCAVASTPVAAGLIAGGLSPGAAMVFLLAGPATNLASLFVLRGEFGKRVFAAYLAAIAGGSIVLGALFDALPLGARVGTGVPHAHDAASPARSLLTLVFLALVAASLARTALRRARNNRRSPDVIPETPER